MTFFRLCFQRDLKQIFYNPRFILLPFGFLSMSLFLIYFTQETTSVGMNLSLYWTLCILSTTGALGQNVARDYDQNFLQALQCEKISLTPYILSKTIALLLSWSVPFW